MRQRCLARLPGTRRPRQELNAVRRRRPFHAFATIDGGAASHGAAGSRNHGSRRGGLRFEQLERFEQRRRDERIQLRAAALGVRESNQVLDLIRQLREQGLPVILISHNMPHVFDVADRIQIQRLGRCVGVITPKTHTMGWSRRSRS